MGKGKLLIAEDERIIALDLKTRLTGFGYEVIGMASSGSEVLQVVRAQRPDLVLMDIFIKGDIDGIQTAQILRRDLSLPVVFITAHSDDTTIQRAKLAEPYGYILKPFDDRELRSTLEMAIYKADAERLLRESEARYRAIVEDQSDLVVRYSPDLTITYTNEPLCRLFQAKPKDLVGVNMHRYVDVAILGLLIEQMEEATANSPNLLFETPLPLLDGSQCWVQWKGQVLFNDSGGVMEIQSVGRDITERRHLEESLRESNERYLLAAEGANDGIWDWDLRSNTFFFSSRLKEILGFSDHELINDPQEWLDRIHPDERSAIQQAFHDHLEAKTPFLRQDCRLRRKDGSYGWFAVRGLAVCKPEHPPHRIAGSVTDISRQKEYEDQLSFKAFHDNLTGLANRSLFINRLQHVLDRYRWPRIGLAAILFLDLDFFKLVNDNFGHPAGDTLLIHTARRIEACLRPGDTIARFGGDEFAILVEDIASIEDAVFVANRIHQQLKAPFPINGKEVYITASIGIADMSGPNIDPDGILRNADIAMYSAKQKGRGRWEIYDAAMQQEIVSHLERDHDLHHAVLFKELYLQYQPIYSTAQKRISGFEALAFWRHPRQGILSQDEFMGAIVENILIEQITAWMLETVCADLSSAISAGQSQVSIALSLSASQLSQPSLPVLIRNSLEHSHISAKHLEIKIPEAAAAEHINRIGPVLESLHELGVTLSIADFGCRYDFFHTLERYGIRRVHLDQSCLGSPESERSMMIGQFLIGLSKAMDLEISADAVETSEQYAWLNSLSPRACDQFQGKLIGGLLEAAELASYLDNPPPAF